MVHLIYVPTSIFKYSNFRMTQKDFEDIVKLEGDAGPNYEELMSVRNSSINTHFNSSFSH